MKIHKITLLTAAVMFASSVNAMAAGQECSSVFGQDIQYAKMDKGVTDKQVEFFKNVVADVNGSLGSLVIPDGVTIKVYTAHPAPVANPIDMSINAGVRFVMKLPTSPDGTQTKDYYKVPTISGPILAHEYGHIVFFQNFGIREPIWRTSFETFRRQLPELEKLDQELRKVNEEIANITPLLKSSVVAPKKSRQLRAQLVKLTAEANRLNQEINKRGAVVQILSAITTSYNEFFADVMAVLHTGKPNSIEDGVTFTRTLQGNKKFSEYMKDTNEERSFENRIKKENDYEEHGYFSLVRDAVWESYLASPSNRTTNRAKVTEAIFEAVAKECSRLIRGKKAINFKDDATWKDLNANLEKVIDQEMAARGITKLK